MADKYMEALDYGSEFLAHYGIKGMKWDASKKKSPAELLAAALKRKQKEALLKKAAATGTEYIRKKARNAAIDRLSASIASVTTPRPSSPDNQHKTNQTYARRNLEESAKRVESKKRNSRFNAKKDTGNKKENIITENIITEKSDKPLSDFKNKITEMSKKQAAKERQSEAKQTSSKKKEKYESSQMKANRRTADNFRENADKLKRQVADRMQESKAKEIRMAEEKRIQDALKDLEMERNSRMNSEEERIGRARERNRLKDVNRRKAQKQQLDIINLAKRARNRKDDIRRALNKAAKYGTGLK